MREKAFINLGLTSKRKILHDTEDLKRKTRSSGLMFKRYNWQKVQKKTKILNYINLKLKKRTGIKKEIQMLALLESMAKKHG